VSIGAQIDRNRQGFMLEFSREPAAVILSDQQLEELRRETGAEEAKSARHFAGMRIMLWRLGGAVSGPAIVDGQAFRRLVQLQLIDHA
jgi:hypothetical protein